MAGGYVSRSRSGGGEDWSLLVDPLDFWRLCDELSVIQAALLIIGENPAESQEYVLGWEPHNRPGGFDAAFAALSHAVQGGRLRAIIRRRMDGPPDWIENRNIEERAVADPEGTSINHRRIPAWDLTTIKVDDLRSWLRERGIKTGFFFPQDVASADYLNATHEHYSPKLAAAINAWEAVTRDPSLLRGKTVKQGLLVWLRRNADKYSLTKEDGSPNEQGIEEVSKIANWDFKGGAPKTPGE